jgi:hypothetical protein
MSEFHSGTVEEIYESGDIGSKLAILVLSMAMVALADTADAVVSARDVRLLAAASRLRDLETITTPAHAARG